MHFQTSIYKAMKASGDDCELDDDDDDSVDNNDGWLIPNHAYSNVHNSLKRVHEWVGAEEAVGITPETSTATPGLSAIQRY